MSEKKTAISDTSAPSKQTEQKYIEEKIGYELAQNHKTKRANKLKIPYRNESIELNGLLHMKIICSKQFLCGVCIL